MVASLFDPDPKSDGEGRPQDGEGGQMTLLEHLLELQGSLMGHVLAHTFREFAGIQGLHREGKQLVGGFDAPVGSRAPHQAGI